MKGIVDTTVTTITGFKDRGEDWWQTIAVPSGYEQYFFEKGAVTLVGVGLTVAAVNDEVGTFGVTIVLATYRRTTLSEKPVGDSCTSKPTSSRTTSNVVGRLRQRSLRTDSTGEGRRSQGQETQRSGRSLMTDPSPARTHSEPSSVS
ncbi:hypothetical protein [Halomarina rubra]|uniref:Lumazine-binding domain-containing protein n=1 Tax=Halomarina rubra TaxID=2071873 RepID=A0ABD6AXF4_9EURY